MYVCDSVCVCVCVYGPVTGLVLISNPYHLLPLCSFPAHSPLSSRRNHVHVQYLQDLGI